MARQKKDHQNSNGNDAEYNKRLRERLRRGREYMDALPTTLPPASVAFGHIKAKIDPRLYDKIPTKLGDPKKYFAGILTKLKWVDEIRTD